MAPGRFLLSLSIVVIFAAGGFGIMQWLQSAPTPIAAAPPPAIPGAVVVNRLEGCEGFNQSIDEAIALQNRIGHPHNSARLAGLKRDCRNDPQEHYRVLPR